MLIYDTGDGAYIYVEGIKDNMIKTHLLDGQSKISLIKQDRNGNSYFKKGGYRVYLNELEEIGNIT